MKKIPNVLAEDIIHLDLRSDFENGNLVGMIFQSGTLTTGGWYIDTQDYEIGAVINTYIYESESEWKQDVQLFKAENYEFP
jgi:hypothetical protein